MDGHRLGDRAVYGDFRRKIGAPGGLADPHGSGYNLLPVLLVDDKKEIIPVGAVKGFVYLQQVAADVIPLLDDLPVVGINHHIVDRVAGVGVVQLGVHGKLGGVSRQDGTHKLVVCRKSQLKVGVQSRIGGTLPESLV